MQHHVRGRRGFVAMCLAWTLDGHATRPETPPEFDLRIMAQPLDEALQEFARQSGVQLIYFSSLTTGIQSSGVRGSYTVAGALEALLAGSGLSFRMLNAHTVLISKVAAGKTPQ